MMEMMIEKAITRYGQVSLWEKIDHIVVDINLIGRMIPALKGIGQTFPHFGQVHIFPHALRAVFFDRNKTELRSFEASTVTLRNKNPVKNYRSKFAGLAKYQRWNLSEAIYFFSYTMITYAGIPFILENNIINEVPWRDGFRIDAKFPKDFHTHNEYQSFYFDKNGLLVRHDYQTEILGWFAYGAHFTSDFKEINGFPMARNRQVYARVGDFVIPIPVLHVSLEPIDVVLK